MNEPAKREGGRNPIFGESFRYVAASALSACVTLAVPFVLHDVFAVSESRAVLASLITVVVMNFLVVRLWVFKSQAEVMPQILKFLMTSIAFRSCEYGLFILLFEGWGVYYLLALGTSLILSFFGKFFVQRHFIFSA